jgi:hypothetical protein
MVSCCSGGLAVRRAAALPPSCPPAHHQQFINCTIGTGICHTRLKTAFEQNQDGTPDDGQRNCPKHVDFHVGVNLGNRCIWLVLLQRNNSVIFGENEKLKGKDYFYAELVFF